MKQLPRNLQNLTLYYGYNNLGQNPDSLKYLGAGIKYLPYNLKYI